MRDMLQLDDKQESAKHANERNPRVCGSSTEITEPELAITQCDRTKGALHEVELGSNGARNIKSIRAAVTHDWQTTRHTHTHTHTHTYHQAASAAHVAYFYHVHSPVCTTPGVLVVEWCSAAYAQQMFAALQPSGQPETQHTSQEME